MAFSLQPTSPAVKPWIEYRRYRGTLLALILGGLASNALAENHALRPSPGGRQQVEDSGGSSKLLNFLTTTFGLQEDFVERSYGKRVAGALRMAQVGDISEIQQVAKTLRDRLGEGLARVGTVLQKKKGTAESDEQVDALIDWLELPREGEAKKPQRQLMAADGPRSVQDFLDDIRSRSELRDAYSCTQYCATASAVDRNICDSACGYAFRSRDSILPK